MQHNALCLPLSYPRQPKFGVTGKIQGLVTNNMRAILIDWIIEVQVSFKLFQETLYLSINILDRCVSDRPASLSTPRSG